MQSGGSGRVAEGDGNELVPLPGGRLPDEEAQIEADPASSPQLSVQEQNDRDERGSSSEISPEESARLWADLKAETGYDSYATYLEKVGRQDIKNLLQSPYLDLEDVHIYLPYCAIFDVHYGESAHPKIDLQCSSNIGTVILSALRHPPATAIARIVLWEVSCLFKDMMDALGLGLRIHPRFFQNLSALARPMREVDLKRRRIAPNIVTISRCVMTIARCYLPANQNVTPVVLIAGGNKQGWGFYEELGESTAFQKPAMPTMKEASRPIHGLFRWMQEYIHLLESDLEKGVGSGGDNTNLSFWSLSPLMKLSAFEIYQQCVLTREKYLSFLEPSSYRAGRPKMEDLFVIRSALRRMIEDSEDSSQQLRRFLSSQMPSETCQSTSSTAVEEELRQARLEASRLETEIRDYLQLQTGESALQESRKSIELSNSQIENESAKRLKKRSLKSRNSNPNNS